MMQWNLLGGGVRGWYFYGQDIVTTITILLCDNTFIENGLHKSDNTCYFGLVVILI